MKIIILEKYGEDWEHTETILCRNHTEFEEQQVSYLRMKNGKVNGVLGIDQTIIEVKDFEDLLEYFTVSEIEEYFPELRVPINKFVAECNGIVFN